MVNDIIAKQPFFIYSLFREQWMRFEWDVNKARKNRKKHKCSFEQASLVFSDRWNLTLFDEMHSASEERWITMGDAGSSGIIVVVHTYRKYDDNEVIRIISARKASRKERDQYLDRRG